MTETSLPEGPRTVLGADGDALGRRLFVAGDADVAIGGAEEIHVTFDADGVMVLVVVLPSVMRGTGPQIADALDRIAVAEVAEVIDGGDPVDGLADAHARFFGADRRHLNHDQEALVVTRDPPDVEAWEELILEVGSQLAGVYLLDGDRAVPLEPPPELRRGTGLRVHGRWVVTATVAAIAGAALLLLRPWVGTPPEMPVARSAVRDVATAAPNAATHNHWIGQDHLVRASDGTLLAVYGADGGLQVVADHADNGRVWREPETVPSVRATASSVTIDDRDRLHVAYTDGSRVAYAILQRRGERWTSGPVLELDAATGTPYVDVAYDTATGVAHVVWIEDAPQGQAPRWAAIRDDGGGPGVSETDRLAPPGTDVSVLVNVAAGPRVVATYRRGDSITGWYARVLGSGDGSGWGAEERVPTDAVVGAADLVVDPSGVAHLVLRDSSTFELTYLTRPPDRPWSGGETAVDATSIDEIDLPSLTVDRTSRLVHLFFQHSREGGSPTVRVATRDPVAGWEPPSPVAPPGTVPDGVGLPSSLGEAVGAPAVLWTTRDATPSLQIALVTP